jgi:MFS superfamily sulfate permease-like transporter
MTTSERHRGLLASLVRSPDACTPSSLPAWLRFVIAFGVLYTLKYALPLLGISLVLQVLILLVVATFIAWRFWWNCSPDRRGVALLIVALWAAGLAKILAQ